MADPKPTHKLSQQARIMIVKALACQERLVDVCAQIKDEFDIELKPHSLYNYIPDRNPNMDADLKTLFEQVEAEFLEAGKHVPFNNRNRRNILRERVFWRHERNPIVQKDLLNDAAKDCGGLFAQRRDEAPAPGDDDYKIMGDNLAHASNEDLARIMSETPDEMIAPDILEFMIKKGFRRRRAALPATGAAPGVEGEIVEGGATTRSSGGKR